MSDLFIMCDGERVPLTISENLTPNWHVPAGYYAFCGTSIELNEKPRRLHRLFARLLLGWRWVESES